MAGLVPAIHAFSRGNIAKTWMPGTRPGMTTEMCGLFPELPFESDPQDEEKSQFVTPGQSRSKNGYAR
jgi:hypothetical protein